MKKILALVLCLILALAVLACKGPEAPAAAPPVEKEPAAPAANEPAVEEPAGPPANPNLADFVKFTEPFEINSYYNEKGVECDVTYTATGGVVNVPNIPTTDMPKANSRYKIGFSVYYTVDEVGAMILDTMKQYAEICGVDLLVNDANYDQNAQNQAIEQWIVEKVDGVILAPCDFYGVKESLDALKAAGIPVITLNPALAGEANAVMMAECVEQGAMAAQLLIDHLLATGTPMKGKVVFQTLPFVHPNAATRKQGFVDAFKPYPDIEIIELTGISPEDHYTAFEGALMSYGDELIGAFGLYSSATIGMLNAKKAANSPVPLTSIDNDKVILEAIYNGELLGSCCYSSTAPAIWTMSQMVNLLNGAEIPAFMFMENTNVTKANVEAMFELYYVGKTLADYMAGIVG